MSHVAVYDTKPYDRDYLGPAAMAAGLTCRFHEFRLNTETASIAQGAKAVCIFVNDLADRPTLERLAAVGVRHIALRCAGSNQVDLMAARELGLTVTRVPAYRPTPSPNTPSHSCFHSFAKFLARIIACGSLTSP